MIESDQQETISENMNVSWKKNRDEKFYFLSFKNG